MSIIIIGAVCIVAGMFISPARKSSDKDGGYAQGFLDGLNYKAKA